MIMTVKSLNIFHSNYSKIFYQKLKILLNYNLIIKLVSRVSSAIALVCTDTSNNTKR